MSPQLLFAGTLTASINEDQQSKDGSARGQMYTRP